MQLHSLIPNELIYDPAQLRYTPVHNLRQFYLSAISTTFPDTFLYFLFYLNLFFLIFFHLLYPLLRILL